MNSRSVCVCARVFQTVQSFSEDPDSLPFMSIVKFDMVSVPYRTIVQDVLREWPLICAMNKQHDNKLNPKLSKQQSRSHICGHDIAKK